MRLRLAVPALSLLFFIPAAVPPAAAQTADEVVEKYLAASGGREALGKIASRRSTGTISISTPNGDLTGTLEVMAKVPNKARVLIKVDLSPMGIAETMTIEQKFDGTKGWTLNSLQGDTEIMGNQLENMRNNVFPSPLLGYKDAGTKVELLPGTDVGGRKVTVLQVTPKTGSAVRMFLDAETYLPLKAVATVSSPEVGELEQTTEYSDYRVVDGIKIAFKVTNTTPLQSISFTLSAVAHNVEIDDALFSVKDPR